MFLNLFLDLNTTLAVVREVPTWTERDSCDAMRCFNSCLETRFCTQEAASELASSFQERGDTGDIAKSVLPLVVSGPLARDIDLGGRS